MKLGPILLTFFFFNAQAFVLMSDDVPTFKDAQVTVRVNNVACTNINISVDELKNMIQEAVDMYWESVSTSAIEFTMGSDVNLSNTLTISGTGGYISNAAAGEIIISCSQNASDFPASTATLALGGISSSGTDTAIGGVALNDSSSSLLISSDRSTIVAVIGHEIGHAIGIGHSDKEYALMYSQSGVSVNENLSNDDADAVTFLYPNEEEAGGLLGACGSITDINNNPPGSGRSFLLGFLLVLLSFAIAKKGKYHDQKTESGTLSF